VSVLSSARIPLICARFKSQFITTERSFVLTAPPRINTTGTTSNPQVVVGSTTTIQCHVTGVPDPEIQWLNNGRPIDTTRPRLRVSAAGRQLEIINSQVSDSGRYTCIAKNDAGIVDRDFDLDVLGIQSLQLLSVAEMEMGQWVMGQMGHHFLDGSHRSRVIAIDPL